jgi:hypothetical protein
MCTSRQHLCHICVCMYWNGCTYLDVGVDIHEQGAWQVLGDLALSSLLHDHLLIDAAIVAHKLLNSHALFHLRKTRRNVSIRHCISIDDATLPSEVTLAYLLMSDFKVVHTQSYVT